MNKIQTMLAMLVLMTVVTTAVYTLFRDPIPFAYDNLPDKLRQTMHKNGVHWAKITVKNNEVFISGTAPSSDDMVFAKSLIQKEAGVSANFLDVKVKDLKTRADFESEEEWEDYKKRHQLPSSGQGSTSNESHAGSSDTPKNEKTQNNAGQVENDRYFLVFRTKSPECKAKNRFESELYEINYKDDTPVIDYRSLTDLDWIAEFDESCPMTFKLFRKGQKDEKRLSERRMDEVRYHLMSAGILSKRIITEY